MIPFLKNPTEHHCKIEQDVYFDPHCNCEVRREVSTWSRPETCAFAFTFTLQVEWQFYDGIQLLQITIETLH